MYNIDENCCTKRGQDQDDHLISLNSVLLLSGFHTADEGEEELIKMLILICVVSNIYSVLTAIPFCRTFFFLQKLLHFMFQKAKKENVHSGGQ